MFMCGSGVCRLRAIQIISNMIKITNSTASNAPTEMNNMDDVIFSPGCCEHSVDISFDHVVLVDSALVDVFSAVDGPRDISVELVEAFCVGVTFSYVYSVDVLKITFDDVLSVVGIHSVDEIVVGIDSVDVVCARNDSVNGGILVLSVFPFAVVSIVLISMVEISRYVDFVDIFSSKLCSVDSVFAAILSVLSVESFRVEEFSVLDSIDDAMVDATFEKVISAVDCVPFEASIIGVLFCGVIFSDDISSGDVISVGIFSVDHFSVGRVPIRAVEALSVRNDSGSFSCVRMASVDSVFIEDAPVDVALGSISVVVNIIDVSFASNASVVIVPTDVPYSVLSVDVASDGLYSVGVISVDLIVVDFFSVDSSCVDVEVFSIGIAFVDVTPTDVPCAGVSTIGMAFVVFTSDNAFSVDVMSVDVAIVEIWPVELFSEEEFSKLLSALCAPHSNIKINKTMTIFFIL